MEAKVESEGQKIECSRCEAEAETDSPGFAETQTEDCFVSVSLHPNYVSTENPRTRENVGIVMRLHVKRGSVHPACGQPATKKDERREKAK